MRHLNNFLPAANQCKQGCWNAWLSPTLWLLYDNTKKNVLIDKDYREKYAIIQYNVILYSVLNKNHVQNLYSSAK